MSSLYLNWVGLMQELLKRTTWRENQKAFGRVGQIVSVDLPWVRNLKELTYSATEQPFTIQSSLALNTGDVLTLFLKLGIKIN